MADTTTEIVNKTILWTDYTANSQTLFTTDASTRYTIKDMEVANNSYTTPPSVVVNNTKVASLSGSLTGTEIIDVSSTVSLTYDTSTALYISVNNITSSATKFSNNVTDGAVYLTSSGFTSGSSTGNTTTTMTALTNASVVVGGWLLNGNFYYYTTDGNSSSQGLYKRAGGPTGTETVIYDNSTTTSYSPCCFDNVSKFYWFNNSNYTFYRYDTATNTTSALGSSIGYPAGTYPLLMYANDYLFYSPSYSGSNYLFWRKISTGATGTISTGGATPYSSNTGYAAFYDSSTGNLTFNMGPLASFGSTYYYYSLNISGSTPTYLGQGSVTSSRSFRYNTSSASGANFAVMTGANGNTNTIYIVDSTMSVISSKVINNDVFDGTSSGIGSYQYFTPSSAVQAVVSPSMRLRITGVKSV
jgi:hypothetical protein